MSRPVGYYVHHHGDGHRQRALAIARAMPDRVTLIGSGLSGKTDGISHVDLPDDRMAETAFDGIDREVERPLSLHYAPLDRQNIRVRAAILADWIAVSKPSLLVVDVSVEIAMFARLCATPTVYVRLSGIRNDVPHHEAFRGATGIIAPFHHDLDDPAVDRWVKAKTAYLPGLTDIPGTRPQQNDLVLVVNGKGASAIRSDLLIEAAIALPSVRWRAIGAIDCVMSELPPNLEILGWVDGVQEEIAAAAVVVGAAGDGLVAAVIAAGKAFICIPEARPFDEQRSKASRLKDLNAAIVLDSWPTPDAWSMILAEAQRLPTANIARLHDPDGVGRAAEYLNAIARDTSARS